MARCPCDRRWSEGLAEARARCRQPRPGSRRRTRRRRRGSQPAAGRARSARRASVRKGETKTRPSVFQGPTGTKSHLVARHGPARGARRSGRRSARRRRTRAARRSRGWRPRRPRREGRLRGTSSESCARRPASRPRRRSSACGADPIPPSHDTRAMVRARARKSRVRITLTRIGRSGSRNPVAHVPLESIRARLRPGGVDSRCRVARDAARRGGSMQHRWATIVVLVGPSLPLRAAPPRTWRRFRCRRPRRKAACR